MEWIALVTTLKGLGFTVGEIVNSITICGVLYFALSKKFDSHKAQNDKRFEKIEVHVGLKTQEE